MSGVELIPGFVEKKPNFIEQIVEIYTVCIRRYNIFS